MTTARDIMTEDAECVAETDTLAAAAKKMADLNVGALPICSKESRLIGVLTDRDIVVRCIAEGGDPKTQTVADLAQGQAITIGADDDAAEILRTMSAKKVRRLPVIDGHQLVGVVALADVARALPETTAGEILEAVSS
jgi:CBS domain-containing protein